MAQVKLIETETPQTFKPVTIQITFETQEELNAMRDVCGNFSLAYEAALSGSGCVKNSECGDFYSITDDIFNTINEFSK